MPTCLTQPLPQGVFSWLAIGQGRTASVVAAFWAFHRASWEHLLLKSGRFWPMDDPEGGDRGSTQD